MRLLRAELPFIKVVMIAGQVPDDEVRELLDGFLQKPVTPSRLRNYAHDLPRTNRGRAAMTEASKSPVQTVLVVEDEVFIRMVISEYLRSCGYKVLEAANADEALIVLQRLEIAVDVVFSDIEMPGSIGGFELAKWLHTHRPEVDVILAGNVPRAAEAASELCESGPLPKPYEPQIAEGRIRQLMARRASRKKT